MALRINTQLGFMALLLSQGGLDVNVCDTEENAIERGLELLKEANSPDVALAVIPCRFFKLAGPVNEDNPEPTDEFQDPSGKLYNSVSELVESTTAG